MPWHFSLNPLPIPWQAFYLQGVTGDLPVVRSCYTFGEVKQGNAAYPPILGAL